MAGHQDDEIVHRQLDTDRGEPDVQIAEIVSELTAAPVDQLEATYDQIDHVLDHIFSNPPAPAAQVEITFTYEGYRITVEQTGNARFVKVG